MKKRSRIIAGVFCLTALFPFLLMNGCLDEDATSYPASAPVDPAASSEEVSDTQSESVSETDPASATEAPASSEEVYTEPTVEPATDPIPIGEPVDWQAMQREMQGQADRFISDDLTSFQFAVMDAGEIVVSGTAGKYDRQQSQSLTAETMYGVASCSKVAATAAVMRLVDQGKVDLDACVTDYLPDFTMADPRYKDITVRMLMNHSSGLYGNTVADAWKLGTFGDTTAHDRFLERLSTQKLKSAPGEYSIYCNDGFTLMELICERVSGMTYADFLRQELFAPLGMEHTFTPQDTFDTAQIAAIYSGDTKLPPLTTDPAQGGLFSTAEDLCRLGKAFTKAGDGVLSKDSIEATGNAEYRNGTWCEPGYSTMNYGLGWDAVDLYPFSEMGIKAVTKNGDVIYSGSQMIVLPEYNLVAAAVGSGSGNGVSKGFLIYSLLQILQEKGVIDSMPTKPALNVTTGSVTDELRSYAGTYIRGWGSYELSFSGNTLVKTAYPSGSKSEYRYIGNGHFTDDSGTDHWFFEKNGRQYHVSRAWDNNTGLIDLPNVQIQGVKVEKNALDSETLSAWNKRAGKSYLLISEPYDSLGYV
ncbi:MAG: beta-lactamase family protein, partial [Oscillospiraceae bacterium]|nr:beta-lactamase family protein [Oscillospiraceae bacterium]